MIKTDTGKRLRHLFLVKSHSMANKKLPKIGNAVVRLTIPINLRSEGFVLEA